MLSQYPLFWSQMPLWKHQTCQMSKHFTDAFPISIRLSLNNCGLAKFHQGNLEQWGTTPKYTLQGETVNKSLSTFHITGSISIVLRGETNQVICILPWALVLTVQAGKEAPQPELRPWPSPQLFPCSYQSPPQWSRGLNLSGLRSGSKSFTKAVMFFKEHFL